MSMFTKDQIRHARRVNLADFLISNFPDEFEIISSNSILQKSNPSLKINRNIPGYHDFSNGNHGNSIDYLMNYKGMSFLTAVRQLCEFGNVSTTSLDSSKKKFTLPQASDRPFTKIVSYLKSRCINQEFIYSLIKEDLLYQDNHNNAVFVNKERDYCEIRGTGSEVFHGCRKTCSDKFWYVFNDTEPYQNTFICEAAIDAISLMQIHQLQKYQIPSVYISIGGVSNQQTINRIKKYLNSVILAVDNDSAGELCRIRNRELKSIIPTYKDWNQDLCCKYH